MRKKVTTYYLEMTDISQFITAGSPKIAVKVKRMVDPDPEYALFLYRSVGREWLWYERLVWSKEEWRLHAEKPAIEIWVAYVDDQPAGYFELEAQSGDQVQILYFGLMLEFIGKGLGSFLLSTAIDRAWEMGASRIWVHTCSLDHPAALGNYQSRGFRIFKEVTALVEIPDPPAEV